MRPASSTSQAVPGTLTGVTLDVSFDGGRSWHKVTLTKDAGGWWTRHASPRAKKPGGFVSVRASAATNSGYSIKQEIIRAYGLR